MTLEPPCETSMISPGRVLVLGSSTYPMSGIPPVWRERCRAAGLEMIALASDRPALENFHLEKSDIMLMLNGVTRPSPLWSEAAADPGCMVLANCLTATPTRLASVLKAENVVAYSDIGLYTGGSVLEIASGAKTDPACLLRARQFLEALGFQTIEMPESPALALGRVLAMLANEAAFALMEGIADAKSIDEAMRLGVGYPRGPLAWADAVGLDVILAILEHLKDEFGEERYHPAPLLRQKVLAGRLGCKTGEGFHVYEGSEIL